MDADSAPDRCPRCGREFHCGMNDAVPCPCTTVTLTAELQQRLKERFRGCLCLACLQAVARGGLDAAEDPPGGG